MKTETAPAFVQLIDRLRETGGLRDTDVANFAGVSPGTVLRWATGREAPRPNTQLLISDLAFVVTRLEEYHGPDEIRAWFYARHPQFDGERAIDLIHDDRTADVLANRSIRPDFRASSKERYLPRTINGPHQTSQAP